MVLVQPNMHPIEKLLIVALRPVFIGSEFLKEEETLNIVICCRSFKYLPVEERIKMVYEIIDNSDEIKEKPAVIVQTFNEEELDELLETMF